MVRRRPLLLGAGLCGPAGARAATERPYQAFQALGAGIGAVHFVSAPRAGAAGGGAAEAKCPRLGSVPEITEDRFPWPPASATGIGSLPGTDPAEAMRLVFGELPAL